MIAAAWDEFGSGLASIVVLLIAIALVVACEKVPTHSRTKHNVEVKREVTDNDEYFPRTYTMSVDSGGIDFYCFKSGLGMPHSLNRLKFRGTDGQNALSVLNTFSQWAATARANHVEPFSKRISSDCVFSTYFVDSTKLYENPCEFSYSGSGSTLNSEFEERDIAKFSELLKQLPEVNAERLAKESKAEQEQSLFKEGTADNLKSEGSALFTPPRMITLTQSVPIQTESGTVTLPVGTKLQFVSQANNEVRVHYLNSDYDIPIDLTDLIQQR
jgi:hypothetical protein